MLSRGASLSLGALPARPSRLARGLRTTASAGRGGGASPVVASSAPALDLSRAKLILAAAPALEHTYPGHPECAERVPAIMAKLAADGLTPEAYGPGIVSLPSWAPATAEQIERVHTPQVLKSLKILSERARGGASMVDTAPTYVTQSTHSDTLVGAGGAVAVLESVVAEGRRREREVPRGPMGFCIVNNASVCARHAQRQLGLKRVLIIDFDVHHGNGTQDAFYSDPDVLFLSTHQAGSYPNTGRADEAGEGDGAGATVNVPLPGGCGDAAAAACAEEVIAPVAVRFRPDVILVSAGFDAHWRDPLAGLQFVGGTYHRLAAEIKRLADELCGGRVVFLLEGGYDLQGLGEGVAEVARALLGERVDAALDPERKALQPEPTDKLKKALLEVKAVHSLPGR